MVLVPKSNTVVAAAGAIILVLFSSTATTSNAFTTKTTTTSSSSSSSPAARRWSSLITTNDVNDSSRTTQRRKLTLDQQLTSLFAEKRSDFDRSVSSSTSPRSSKGTGPLFVSNVLSQGSASASSETDSMSVISTKKKDDEKNDDENVLDKILSGYLGPRLLLGFIACFYATNFPLGAIMADALPASAVTSARMVIAGLAMSPFVFKLDKELRLPAVSIGCFTAMGYITQSMALVDTSPATVSFLGTATVLVCPFLEWAIDKKPMSIQQAPQTWLAAILCMAGVGVLELLNPSGGGLSSSIGMGDGLALLQAVGFGTQVYLSEKMIRGKPDQALPVTATLVCTTAFLSALWCFADGWVMNPDMQLYSLPQLFFQPELQIVAAAVVWTGLVSTALNFFVEMTALGRVPPAEASVILATEPMWAALFAAGLLGESFGMNDYVGGALIIMACLANSLKPSDFETISGNQGIFGGGGQVEEEIH